MANKPLSQVVCVLRVARSGAVSCQVLRPLMAHDMAHGLPHNAVVLQLSWVETQVQRGLLLVSPLTTQDEVRARRLTFLGGWKWRTRRFMRVCAMFQLDS